jgi:hypothetical protein
MRTPGCGISAHRIVKDSALFPFIGRLERAAGFERDDTPLPRGSINCRCSLQRARRQKATCNR